MTYYATPTAFLYVLYVHCLIMDFFFLELFSWVNRWNMGVKIYGEMAGVSQGESAPCGWHVDARVRFFRPRSAATSCE